MPILSVFARHTVCHSAVRMDHVITSAHALLRDDSGQDLTEYGLLASLIAILAIVALGDLGVLIGGLWDDIVLQLATVL